MIGRIAVSLLAAAAIGCGGAAEESAPPGAGQPAESSPPAMTKDLDPGDVAARLGAGEELFLLDVRTAEELEQDGAIEGYVHIPIDELQARMNEVPKDKPIVAY